MVNPAEELAGAEVSLLAVSFRRDGSLNVDIRSAFTRSSPACGRVCIINVVETHIGCFFSDPAIGRPVCTACLLLPVSSLLRFLLLYDRRQLFVLGTNLLPKTHVRVPTGGSRVSAQCQGVKPYLVKL